MHQHAAAFDVITTRVNVDVTPLHFQNTDKLR